MRETKAASMSLWRRRSLKWKNSNGGVSEIESQLVQGWDLITPVGAPPEAVVDNIEKHPAKRLRKDRGATKEDGDMHLFPQNDIWLLAFLKSLLYKNCFGNFFNIFTDWFFHSLVPHFLDTACVLFYVRHPIPVGLHYRSAFSSFPHNLEFHVRFSLCSCFNTLIVWLFHRRIIEGPLTLLYVYGYSFFSKSLYIFHGHFLSGCN